MVDLSGGRVVLIQSRSYVEVLGAVGIGLQHTN